MASLPLVLFLPVFAQLGQSPRQSPADMTQANRLSSIPGHPQPGRLKPPSWPPAPHPPTPFQSLEGNLPVALILAPLPKSLISLSFLFRRVESLILAVRRTRVFLAGRFSSTCPFPPAPSPPSLPSLPPLLPLSERLPLFKGEWRENIPAQNHLASLPSLLDQKRQAACPAHARHPQQVFLFGISQAHSKVQREK